MPTTTRTTQTNLPADAWESTDPLGETLHSFRLEGVVYARSRLTAPWGIAMPPMPGCLMFHIVTAGSCRLEFADQEAATIRPGEFALMPRGEGHAIKHDEGVAAEPFFDLPIQRITPRYELLDYGGGGEETTLICGAVRFDHPAAGDLIELLPSLIHIRTWNSTSGNSAHAEWMHSTLRLMAAEASTRQPGGETVVTRLADILVIQAIRSWLLENPASRRGWLGALDDKRIGPAILQIHREPTKDWTVASLAQSVSMSRSAFSARFTELIGESAMQYLTRWRMHLAGSWLREGDITAAECGARLGYNSEAAFSRAFKRVMGQPPGAWQSSEQPPGA
ncbi:MAG: AraC family transcriptional regulator [Phycisphaerales bacterium JB058]